jgi:hypothetical protein
MYSFLQTLTIFVILFLLFVVTTDDHSYYKDPSVAERQQTPVKVALSKIIKRQKVTIHRLRRRHCINCHKKVPHFISKNLEQLISAITAQLPQSQKHLAMFIASQIRLCRLKKHGRRYTVADKSLALSLYYASPQAYRMCSRLFCLPSVSMLRLWMSKIDVTPGFCTNVFVMMQQKSQKLSDSDRMCALVFDEITLKTAVTYDKFSDSIVGYENFGEFGSTEKPANHALVLMARGLKSKWKQPLAYFLVSNTTSAERLKVIVEHCIKQLSSANFTTVCVICDQGATNQQMFKMFSITTEKPYAIVANKTVFFMFDPPHLLKSLRNNLMKHDFELNGNVIKWDHIVKFYERDCHQMLKLAPKLTDKHLNLPPFAGMRVRLATQTFSHSVAAGISTHVSFGALPEEAKHTAEFIELIDGLFDCLNSGAIKSAKQLNRPLSVNSSHWEHFSKCLEVFKQLKVVKSKCGVPCINGFQVTITAVTMLFEHLHVHGFKFLLTNRLNQDCLENHFSIIRGRGGFRDNPDPYFFRTSFRQVLVKHLLCPPQGSNCSNDMTEFLLQLQDAHKLPKMKLAVDSVVCDKFAGQTNLQLDCFSIPESTLLQDDDSVLELNALVYVSGYVCKVVLRDHDCDCCRKELLRGDSDVCVGSMETFLDCKLYKHCKQDSLHRPSERLVQLLSGCRDVFIDNFDKVKHEPKVFRQLLEKCCDVYELLKPPEDCAARSFLKCSMLFIRVLLYHKVKVINRGMADSSKQSRKNRKAAKVMHK